MNTLTKSAVVVASIAGASGSATNLRLEVAANSNFEQSLNMQSWETSFLEKAAEAYDCVGTTLEQITEVEEKSAEKKQTVEHECDPTRHSSKYYNAQTLHDAELAKIDDLEAKRKEGNFPLVYDCEGPTCETPNSVRTAQKKANEDAHSKAISDSDGRVADSKALITQAEKVLRNKQEEEGKHAETVANTIKTKKKAIELRIDDIASRLNTDKETALENKKSNLKDADDAKKTAQQSCDNINKDRLDLIEGDGNLLKEIQEHLETLKMCTAAHAHQGATDFLEIKAVQRLEAHCAASRQRVAEAAPSGDLTAWFAKLETEKKAAAATLTQCYEDAKEVERAAVEGPALSPNTVSGFNYVYNEAVRVLDEAAVEATKAENTAIEAMKETEEATKDPYKSATQDAQDNLDLQKSDHDNVVAFEKGEIDTINGKKTTDDTQAGETWDLSLGGQFAHLNGQRTAENSAFATTNQEIKEACEASISEMKEEAEIINKIKAKIELLKVVRGEEAKKVIRPTEPGYVFQPSQTATSVSVGEENTWDAVLWGVPSTAYTVKYAITNAAGESTDQKEITCTFGGIAKPGCVGAQCDDTKDTVVISDKDGKIPLNTISNTGSHKIIEFKLTEAKAIEVVPSFDADYMVLTYEFKSGADLDTRTRMIDPDVGQGPAHPENAVQMNTEGRTKLKNSVGWSYQTQWPKNKPFLTWGGDNTGRGYESALLNIQEFKKAYPNAKELTMDFRAFWYGKNGHLPVKLASHFFKGGKMVKDGYSWKNTNAADQLSFDNQGSVVKSRNKTGPGERIATFNYNFATGFGMFDNKDLKENK